MQIIKLFKSFFLLTLIAMIIMGCSQKKIATYDSEGHPFSLDQYKGKWVIINYWARWCPPCLAEMPALQKLYHDYPQQLIVLGVNFDGDTDSEIKLVKNKYRLHYPMTSSFPISSLGIDKIPVLPTSFIISPNGKIFKILTGPHNEIQFKNIIGLSTSHHA